MFDQSSSLHVIPAVFMCILFCIEAVREFQLKVYILAGVVQHCFVLLNLYCTLQHTLLLFCGTEAGLFLEHAM